MPAASIFNDRRRRQSRSRYHIFSRPYQDVASTTRPFVLTCQPFCLRLDNTRAVAELGRPAQVSRPAECRVEVNDLDRATFSAVLHQGSEAKDRVREFAVRRVRDCQKDRGQVHEQDNAKRRSAAGEQRSQAGQG